MERTSRDYLAFRLALGEELIRSFRGRKRNGRPCSLENENLDRLIPPLGHLAEGVSIKRDCAVCVMKRKKEGEYTSNNRHESRIKCKLCGLHLCY